MAFTDISQNRVRSQWNIAGALLHKQQQLHHWEANHPGSSRTQRKSRGPTRAGPVLYCWGRAVERPGEGEGWTTTCRRWTPLPHHYSSQHWERQRGGSDQSMSSALLLPEQHYNLGLPLTILQLLISLRISLHIIWLAVQSLKYKYVKGSHKDRQELKVTSSFGHQK